MDEVNEINRYSRSIGALFICTGIVVIIFGMYRYFIIQHYLQQNKFPAARGVPLIVFFISFALIAITFGILLHIVP